MGFISYSINYKINYTIKYMRFRPFFCPGFIASQYKTDPKDRQTAAESSTDQPPELATRTPHGTSTAQKKGLSAFPLLSLLSLCVLLSSQVFEIFPNRSGFLESVQNVAVLDLLEIAENVKFQEAVTFRDVFCPVDRTG